MKQGVRYRSLHTRFEADVQLAAAGTSRTTDFPRTLTFTACSQQTSVHAHAEINGGIP